MALAKKLACPSCGTGLRVAESVTAGKRIRCPKCGDAFAVPPSNGAARPRKSAAPVEDDENPFEVVDERPAPRLRRKKKKAAANSSLVTGLVVGGAAFAVVAVVILAVALWPSGNKSGPAAAGAPSRPAPPAGGEAVASAAGAAGGSGNLAEGREVFEANCARCHTIGGAGEGGGGRGRGRSRGPDLASVGRDPSHTIDWLMAFIRDPKSQKPEARMPKFDDSKISQQELRALAEFLASLK